MKLQLPKLEDLDVSGKRVLVRGDVDVGRNLGGVKRLEVLVPTIDYLTKKGAKIIIIGHNGRPGGKVDESLSLKPAGEALEVILRREWGKKRVKELEMHIRENLRFDPGEEENDEHFVEHLAHEGDIFVNEAFAASHRKHASIVSLPKFLPHACGIRFCLEIENLSKVLESPKKPVVAIVSGIKKDKLSYLSGFSKLADKILIGGRLPEYLDEDVDEESLVVARLTQDKEDITVHSIERFEAEIAKAETIVVSGPVGKFEDGGHRQGTQRVFEAVADSGAFKVAGGGDTRNAISMLGLEDKFDWISAGGGAMLEFLARGTLPGIEALLD